MQNPPTTNNPFERLSRKELAVMPSAAASYARWLETSTAQALHILTRMHPDAFYYQPTQHVAQEGVPASQEVANYAALQGQPATIAPVPPSQGVINHAIRTGESALPTMVTPPSPELERYAEVEKLQQITGISQAEELATDPLPANPGWPATTVPQPELGMTDQARLAVEQALQYPEIAL
jgi:hypothetical protein